MNQPTYDKTRDMLHVLANAIVEKKRPDYTQESVDVLANFKDAAKDAGVRPLQAWMIHFQKQYSAVARHVKNPAGNPSEPIQERFADLLNYIDLGFALWVESQEDKKPQ